MSYEEADVLADYAGRGLRVLGQPSNTPLCIYADTRAEWMLTAQACFKQSFPVVTLYTNLGEEAIAHGLNETEVETVITSHELLPKFRRILKNTPHVKKIIYFENPIKKTNVTGIVRRLPLLEITNIIHYKDTKKMSNLFPSGTWLRWARRM